MRAPDTAESLSRLSVWTIMAWFTNFESRLIMTGGYGSRCFPWPRSSRPSASPPLLASTGLRPPNSWIQADSGCRVQGSGPRMQGTGCRVQSAGYRVQGSGFESPFCLSSPAGICGHDIKVMVDLMFAHLVLGGGGVSHERCIPVIPAPCRRWNLEREHAQVRALQGHHKTASEESLSPVPGRHRATLLTRTRPRPGTTRGPRA